LDGPYGLWNLYQPADAEVFYRDVGREFQLLETGFKQYPVCGANHATLAALDKLLDQTPIAPDDVIAIEAFITPLAVRLVGNPYDTAADPMVLAQYCLAYAVAAKLLYGQVGLRELEAEQVLAPKVATLASRVSVQTLQTTTDPLALAPAELVVTLRDGRVLKMTENHVPGSAEAPLAEAAFFEKLEGCARYGAQPMPDEQFARIVELVTHLESLDDIRALSAAVSLQ